MADAEANDVHALRQVTEVAAFLAYEHQVHREPRLRRELAHEVQHHALHPALAGQRDEHRQPLHVGASSPSAARYALALASTV